LALYTLREGVRFKARYQSGLQIVNGDPVSIRQVIHNLIKNSLEAVGLEGLIEINVHRVLKNNTDFIEIALYDNGAGIKEDQVEKIFEPYVTTKVKGTGLGLAIVKKIIEDHGGAIWVDNGRKVGAGFIIQLPACNSELS
jgi:nitrogen fixation/metabolism regulation signal transduction histidine kinase